MTTELSTKADYHMMYVMLYHKFIKGELQNFEFTPNPTDRKNKDFIKLSRNRKTVEMICYISGCELKRRFETNYFIEKYLYFSDLILLLQETTGLIVKYNRSELSECNLLSYIF